MNNKKENYFSKPDSILVHVSAFCKKRYFMKSKHLKNKTGKRHVILHLYLGVIKSAALSSIVVNKSTFHLVPTRYVAIYSRKRRVA